MRHLKALYLGLLFMLAQINPAAAGVILNGDFDTGLTGWSTVVNGGDVAWASGQAQLTTGSGTGPSAAVLVQGDDGFFTFNSPITLAGDDLFLHFDALFADLGIDASEVTPNGFSDQLNLWIYDADSLDQWLAGAFSLLAPGGVGLRFDLTAPADLRGKRVAFSFELTDEEDGHDSTVSIDNVRIEQRPAIPAPGTLVLVAGGLVGGAWYRRRRGGAPNTSSIQH